VAPEEAAEADSTPGRRADRKQVKQTDTGQPKRGKGATSSGVAAIRTRIGQLLWLICVVFALFMAVGALTYALDANPDNALVKFVRDGANAVDLGVFTLENGIKEFVGKNSDTKNALFNWGLGAVFWLVVGRLLDRIVRP
jgi:hypothetical protein